MKVRLSTVGHAAAVTSADGALLVPGRTAPATVLIVDDDPAPLEVFRRALEHAGFAVLTSGTGHFAIELLRQHSIDLAIVDLNLPDMSGMEIIRLTATEGSPGGFILVSAFLTIEVSVEAMKLGAFDVLAKPIAIERLLEVVQDGMRRQAVRDNASAGSAKPIYLRSTNGHPGSAAHRWAMYVVQACESEGDLRTLEDWARCAGVSYSTLGESCRILGIQPHSARDFTRALRAMIKSSVYRCEPSVLLDVSDRRTLKVLVERAGPAFRSGEAASVLQFIRQQLFVPTSNEGIRLLLGYFERP